MSEDDQIKAALKRARRASLMADEAQARLNALQDEIAQAIAELKKAAIEIRSQSEPPSSA
jgi:hypothetical protein